jgi:two-component system cell cycle response regulator DivK
MGTILLIEDNRDCARMVNKIIEPRGHSVVHAATALDGLKLARSLRPDLILLDMDLPDLEGKVVVNQLRIDPGFRTTPIVAFTAENSSRAKRMALAFGCTDFISKPIDTRTFPTQVETLMAAGAGETLSA